MPRTRRFIDSSELYDAIYHFKDYAGECVRLQSLIDKVAPEARILLDVACGTGEHARFLKQRYAVDGVDLNDDYLHAAQLKNPSGNYAHADMMKFDLGRTYDIVTCLFSAIGIAKSFEQLERAVVCMARHVRTGGVLIVEPWFTPENWRPPRPFILAGEVGTDKVYRFSNNTKQGRLSVLQHNYLRTTPNRVEQCSERIELGLFTRDEMTWAFEFAGMEVRYDSEGLMGRGLYIGKKLKRVLPSAP